ncbi:MAG: hypothetical protein U1F49_07500 [Rubrivivax sp.]
MRFGEPLALAAAGAAQTLAFVHTGAWLLPWLAAAVLAARLARARPGRAFVLGWAFGTGWLLAGVWWLFISMHRYGALPALLAAAAVVALAAALSLYLGAAAAVFARWRRGTPAADAALFAALWLLAELARGVLFTGFPWVASGYSQVDAPWRRWRRGWACTASARCWRAWRRGGAGDAPLGARSRSPSPRCCCWPRCRCRSSPARRRADRGLVQTNVPQDEKFAAERLPQTLAEVHKALLEARADLVVLPETAVPLLPGQLQDFVPGYWQGSSSTSPPAGPASSAPRSSGRRWATSSAATPTRWRACRPSGRRTATTRRTSCLSASSSRGAFAGSPT